MKLYPIVLKLDDRICSFVGGGKSIYKKIYDLLPYSPKIFLLAEYIIDELEELVQNQKKIIWIKYINYQILLKSYLIFLSDEKVIKNQIEYEANPSNELDTVLKFAKKYSKFVSFLDRPQYCDFYNTHIYEKDSILVSISTYGHAPVVGKYIKKKLDDIITDDLIKLTEFLSKYRSKIIAQIKDFEKRKQLYDQLLQPSFLEVLRNSEDEALGILLQLLIQYSK